MAIVNEDAFCNSSFWDAELSWNTENPDLSLCFEQTALAWTPCLLLWVLSPLQVYFILTSKNRLVPWHFLNISRLVLNLVLIGVCAVNLCWSLILYFVGEKVFPVEVWTPLIQTITFVLAALILLWNRVRGIYTCAVLFFFWLSLSIGGLAQFRTEIRQSSTGVWQEHQYKFTLYMLYYPGVLVMLILNLFADPQPEETYYPKTKKLSPEIKASYPSRMVFGWFDQLVWKGFRKPLTVADLWDLRYQDTSAQVVPRFDESWKQCFETKKESSSVNGISNSQSKSKVKKPVNIIYPILKTFWYPILAGAMSKVMGEILSFVNPQILNFMIKFVAGKEQMWKGFMYAIGMFVAAELQTFFFHQNLIKMYTTGLNWKTSLMSTIYKKALRISNSARKTSTVGEVVNLMAADVQRCGDFAPFMHLMWTAPLVIIIAIYFLWHILGIASLAGLAVLVIIIPINTLIANKVKTMQMQQLKFKDERVKVMNEVLTGIKVLKLYAWEPSFRNEMLKIREKEISVLRRAALWNASTSFVWQCSSFLVSFVTFAVFVMIDERNVLNSEIAFVSSALFNVIRGPISVFPMMVQMFVQSVVSMRRINKFMNAEELDLTSVSHDETREEPLIIERGTFSWGTEEADKAILRNITLRVKTGSLVAVVGAVGSGKSSLISAFLGEMDKISGYVNTKGQIAYVPQQAWIQNATVRDNIIFGNSFDNKRYLKVVEACALKEDFEMLPGGDSTEIGEKGINLSGGQKQRVSLARAVYHNADTYLLDDPLSAVDSHVGKHIFENVIGPKGQLRKKTRILVTHGIWFLPYVDTIIVMKNGEITEEGTYKELLAKKGEFSEFLTQHSKDDEEVSDNESVTEYMNHSLQRQKSKSGSIRSVSSTSTRKTSIKSVDNIESFTMDLDRLIQAEKTETGSVKMSVYMHYLRSVGLFLTLCTVGFQLISQALTMGANVTLSKWSSDPQAAQNGVQNVDKRNFYLEVFTAFGFGGMAAVVVSAYALAFGTTLASHHLHLSMLTNILRAPMSFFDTTPTGRIVNRIGKDVDVIDNAFPFSLSNAMSCFGNVIGTVVVITWSTPLFTSAILPLGLLYYFVQKIYVTASRQLKRIESVSRSPIYSHFSETISGAPSIRAYKVEARFIKTLEDRVDANNVCLYLSLVSNRWLGIRLETVGNILIFFAATFAVLGRDSLDAGIVGLSVSYALQITGMLSYAVRMSSEVETNIVSVERIKEYAEIPQEAAWEVMPKPEPSWPNHGTVHFDNYQVRYREGLEMVLRGVSFVVNGGEKIGIVGRTGAGKSSLTLCLFRILEAAGGHIYIDGIDIANIGLGDLRSKLTIIPQDPVLFSGTLRSNLDPFEAYSDSQIWQALELAHLKNFTSSLKAGLSHKVTEGGDNLSIGQRQLVCLARALLRKSQVLILDEATAAIDLETDDLIQQTIRREFRDCTVLTIAHRLNTIMDSDRVIVLEKGTIKEFDSPANLLQSPASTFYGLAADCGLVKRNVPFTEKR